MLDVAKMLVMDRYTIVARVLPASIVAFPSALIAYTWAPFELNFTKGATAATIFVPLAYALSYIVRDAGKRLEERLILAWGGWPSTAVLRHRDSTYDETTKSRFHKRLIEVEAVESMPTKEEEAADPVGADIAFTAAATWLRGKTRDVKKFPLIFEENINYGFVRNLLGSRPYALTAAILCVGSDALLTWLGRSHGNVAILATIYGLSLTFGLSKSGLRRQSFAYARRLVEAIDALNSPKVKAKSRSRKSVAETAT